MSTTLMILEMLGSGALVQAGHLANRFYQRRKAIKNVDIEDMQDDLLREARRIDNHLIGEWNEQYLKHCNEKGIHCETVGSLCLCKDCVEKREKQVAEARSARQNMDHYYNSYSSSADSWTSDYGSSSSSFSDGWGDPSDYR